MELYDSSEEFARRGRSPVVAAVGIFDGVHVGHQQLMRKACEIAKAARAAPLVYTFRPHPVHLLSPEQCPKLLTTPEQKLRHIGALGIEATVVESFTLEFSKQTPRDFFERVIRDRLGAKAVVVGYDFTFGMHRQGTIETFEELGREAGVQVSVVPAVFAGETLVSSTVIRSMVAAGEVACAAELLGRPYEIVGSVIRGRGFGTTLAARTANLDLASELAPKDGVYVTRTLVHEGDYDFGRATAFPSVTSIGDNPTFADNPHSVETHLIDAEVNLKGKLASIEFLEHMRDQARFASVDELRAQIHRDIDAARDHHRRQEGRNGKG